MYELISETETNRVYENKQTGTRISTSRIYVDGAGRNWWGFDDLMAIPFIRKKASEHITQQYNAGVTKKDFETFIANLKKVLKSTDPDKYEHAFAEVIRVENIMASATNPVAQSLALCTVYVMADDERPDTFDLNKASSKVADWTLDPDAQAFFLNWLTDGMNAYIALYGELSQLASK